MAVEPFQERDGLDELAGLPELAQPFAEALGIGGKEDMGEDGELGQGPGIVDEGIMDSVGLDAEIERIGIVVVEDELAVDHELVGALGEIDQGDAVAVNVAHPVDGVGGADGEDGAFDVEIVALRGDGP